MDSLRRWTEFPAVRITFYARHSIQMVLDGPCSLLGYAYEGQRQACLPSFNRIELSLGLGGERERHRGEVLYLVICAGETFWFHI